ncbi:hypothetical protein ES708_34417 [subsurface metagenome]
MTVEIQGTTPTEKPNDIVLTSGTFDGNSLPAGGPPVAIWLPIPLTPKYLPPGIMHSIIVYGGDNTNKIGWNANSMNPYPSGRTWYWRPAPWYWQAFLSWDFLFEEWGHPS